MGAASYDPFSKQQFREFLQSRGKTPQRSAAVGRAQHRSLVRDWKDCKCQALADHYAAMSRYIRSLNPQCAVECNPGAVSAAAARRRRHRSRPAAAAGQCVLGRELRGRLVGEDGDGPNPHPHAQSRGTLQQLHVPLLRERPGPGREHGLQRQLPGLCGLVRVGQDASRPT